jgi:hypothetical protein
VNAVSSDCSMDLTTGSRENRGNLPLNVGGVFFGGLVTGSDPNSTLRGAIRSNTIHESQELTTIMTADVGSSDMHVGDI